MRVMFGLLGLVLTLFAVMQLVKIQTATTATAPEPVQPAVAAPSDGALPALQGNPKQVQEQYQRALDGALKAGQQRLEAAEKP